MVPSTFSRLKAARCLPVVLAALIFAGCGTHTPDQSTAYMQGTAQADSAFYLQQMQQSSDDTRINWQLLAIRALVKEGKTGQAVELFNQLPQELNDSQRREKTLLAAEIKLAQKDFAGAQNLLAKITPADLEQNQQARYWQAKIDASQGRPSIDLLRALIAQEPLLGAKEKQQNIDATWQALSSMTQEQANTLVINADENILQGWLDLQRVWFDNRNDPDMMKAGIADWQKRYPNNPGAKMLPTQLVNVKAFKPASTNKIALMLPLNGQAAVFGRTIQQGFEAAKNIGTQPVAGEGEGAAEAAAELDSLCSLAETAVRNGYTCPELDMSGVIDIRGGRHPVVELMQRETRFVPNDAYLNMSTDRLAVITGPNMAGKSTYLRQTALIVLMAQMGSYVPARSASIGVVDRVFTRIGASDDLSGGRSTFMVEMTEVAEILKSATEDSLILLDEIGRGTSTYDGVAIARAVLEFCADPARLGARTLLATHYHELTELEGRVDGVKNYCSTARKRGGSVIFLRHIARGAADESYGIEVAKLAGVPESVIRAADAHLRELNAQGAVVKVTAPAKPESDQVSLADVGADAVAERLRAVDPNTLSPLEALRLLFELKNDLG